MSKNYYDDEEYGENQENVFHDLRVERRLAKKKRLKKRIFGVIFVVLFCVALYSTSSFWIDPLTEFFQKSKESIISDGALEQGKGYPISLSQSDDNYISRIDNKLVVISDTHISYYDDNGKRTLNLQHFFANPTIKEMKSSLLVYDINGYNFSVFNAKGVSYTKKSDETILIAEGGKEHVAVVTKTDKYNSYLTIYNKLGEIIFKWSSGQRIVNIAFNSDDTGCIVSTITSSGGVITSKLVGLQFDTTEEIFESESLGCLICQVKICDNGDMWVLGDNILYRIKSDGTVIYSYSYPKDLANFYLDEKTAALVFNNIADKGSTIVMFGDSEKPSEYITKKRVNQIKVTDGETSYLCDDEFATLSKSANIIALSNEIKAYTDFINIGNKVYFLGYNEIAKMSFKN
ncbi:MAG: hypothetical protein GX896_02490 [Clostridiales bacterium]|nr:hypothetical protein [Clostridiales bacterium]